MKNDAADFSRANSARVCFASRHSSVPSKNISNIDPIVLTSDFRPRIWIDRKTQELTEKYSMSSSPTIIRRNAAISVTISQNRRRAESHLSIHLLLIPVLNRRKHRIRILNSFYARGIFDRAKEWNDCILFRPCTSLFRCPRLQRSRTTCFFRMEFGRFLANQQITFECSQHFMLSICPYIDFY